MTSTIDRLGRLVIPKKIRDRLQLGPGAEVEIEEQDGVIHIRPATAPVTIKGTNHGPVAEPDEPLSSSEHPTIATAPAAAIMPSTSLRVIFRFRSAHIASSLP